MTGPCHIAPAPVRPANVAPPVALPGRAPSDAEQSFRAKLLCARGLALLGLAICGLLASSCATGFQASQKSEYLRAMEALRDSARPEGIPRAKVFHHFQLLGVSSKRNLGGGWDGFVRVWEEWQLPAGFRLRAIKHICIGRDPKVLPAAAGDTILVIKEESYHEPRLEPYFDNIVLLDNRGRLVAELKTPVR